MPTTMWQEAPADVTVEAEDTPAVVGPAGAIRAVVTAEAIPVVVGATLAEVGEAEAVVAAVIPTPTARL